MRHGILLINKPKGPTSHDIVDRMRRVLHERDIGHLGTLDPNASGLMALAVGSKALKIIELFNGLPKEYDATVRMGAVSTTYDAEGVIEEVKKLGWEPPEQGVIQRVIQDHFLGKIDQTPPIHSAVHVGGERAYRKARQGKNVVMPSRKVEITRCDILSYDFPIIRLHVACSAGTYIRSIAHDLGHLLFTAAYLEDLVRTNVGAWQLQNAVDPEKAAWGNVMPLKDILASFPSTELSAEDMEHARCGRALKKTIVGETIGWLEGLPVCILKSLPDGSGAHARKVF